LIYKVEFTPQGLDDISKLDKSVVKRIIQKIEWLAKNLRSYYTSVIERRI